MKKSFLPIILFTLIIAGCNDQNNGMDNLSIVTPTGAPALAFYHFFGKKNFSTNGGDVANIMSQMVLGKSDIVVLPTNVGVNAIQNKHLDYKLAATITFGNLYLVSTGNDLNNQLDSDDYVVLFQKGSVPDLIFNDIYYGLTNINYVANTQIAASCLLTGKDVSNNNSSVDYVLMAEPALTKIKKSQPQKDFIVFADLQKKYKEKHNNQEIYQASIFMKSNLNNEIADNFLFKIKEDINNLVLNPDILDSYVSNISDPQTFLGIDLDSAKDALKQGNLLGLNFKMCDENKNDLDTFLSIFEIGETDEKIFYK